MYGSQQIQGCLIREDFNQSKVFFLTKKDQFWSNICYGVLLIYSVSYVYVYCTPRKKTHKLISFYFVHFAVQDLVNNTNPFDILKHIRINLHRKNIFISVFVMLKFALLILAAVIASCQVCSSIDFCSSYFLWFSEEIFFSKKLKL